MSEDISIADLLAQAETNLTNAKDTARKRLALLDEERTAIKALLGRRRGTPKAPKEKKTRKPRITSGDEAGA